MDPLDCHDGVAAGEDGPGVPEGDACADGVVDDRIDAAVVAKMLPLMTCRRVDQVSSLIPKRHSFVTVLSNTAKILLANDGKGTGRVAGFQC